MQIHHIAEGVIQIYMIKDIRISIYTQRIYGNGEYISYEYM